MKIAEYVTRKDPKFPAIGRIVAVTGNDVRVLWIVSWIRTTHPSEQLRVICGECAGNDCFGDDQLARQKRECSNCKP